jgi:anti-sigma factor RsiW
MKHLDDSTLVAHVDGELDAARAQEVEAALDLDPELRSRARIFRETSRVLRTALGGSSREAVSPRLAQALERPRTGGGGRRRRRLAVPLAASLAALTVGLGGGYIAGIQHTQRIGHADVDHWLEEAGKYYRLYAEDESYLIEINAEEARSRESKLGDWLNGDLRIPDLSRHGLTFLGARFVALEVDPAASGEAQPAIMLVYHLPEGKPLALCILPYGQATEKAQGMAHHADMNQLYWISSGYGYVLQGWADEGLLRELAAEIELQLRDV